MLLDLERPPSGADHEDRRASAGRLTIVLVAKRNSKLSRDSGRIVDEAARPEIGEEAVSAQRCRDTWIRAGAVLRRGGPAHGSGGAGSLG